MNKQKKHKATLHAKTDILMSNGLLTQLFYLSYISWLRSAIQAAKVENVMISSIVGKSNINSQTSSRVGLGDGKASSISPTHLTKYYNSIDLQSAVIASNRNTMIFLRSPFFRYGLSLVISITMQRMYVKVMNEIDATSDKLMTLTLQSSSC